MEVVFGELSNIPGIDVDSPKAFILHDISDLSPLDNFKFPLICKTTQASGGLSSHEMAIINTPEQLSLIPFSPIYAQEFFNHDATIIKVYCIGSKIWIMRRKSIKNIDLGNDGPIFFNSQDMKDELPPQLSCDYAGNLPIPDQSEIDPIANALSELLGLSIFGFDVIKNINTGKWAVIDINYFPDFRGVDFFETLKNHLFSKLKK